MPVKVFVSRLSITSLKDNTAEPMRLFRRESALNHSADWCVINIRA